MTTSALAAPAGFSEACRRWRRLRKLSQLELALAAGVSQRHLSWLETGRSQPSREMVVRLSEALDVPLRERNALLQAAGFSALYTERRLDEAGMEPVLTAIHHLLAHHDPFPAVAVDRFWDVKLHNAAAARMLGLGLGPAAEGEASERNLAVLSLHPEGLRRHIANWDQVGPSFVRRLRVEALASGDPALQARFEDIIEMAGPLPEPEPVPGSLLPVLPVELAFGDRTLRLFSVITTVGTPQDVTADELRVEAFLPADPDTDRFFRDLPTEPTGPALEPTPRREPAP